MQMNLKANQFAFYPAPQPWTEIRHSSSWLALDLHQVLIVVQKAFA